MQISVIIPTYRPGNYLWHCLDSLVGQSLDKRFYEIIIVLNGETDIYVENIKRYIATVGNVNIRLICTATKGVSNARNIGLDNASGKYICFIDDDDWVSCGYMEHLLKIAENDCIMVSNVRQLEDITFKETPHYINKSFKNRKNISSQFEYRKFLSSSCAKLIPCNVIGQSRFDTKFTLGEDSLFMFDISKRIKGIRFSGEDDVYYVRERRNSASRSRQKYMSTLKNICHLICSYTTIWFKGITQYNFKLYLSRIAATMMKLFPT